jgi:predicted Fe-S protein YdhL (DUF1289 family)
VFAATDFNRRAPAGPDAAHCIAMPPDAPQSPCINVCSIGPRGWCRGCYRTLDEIAGWVRLDAAAQWAIIRATEARRAEALPHGGG